VLFIYLDTDEEDNARVMEFFGLKLSECPTFRYIHLGDDMLKYKPDSGDITTDAVTSFVESIVDGKRQVTLEIFILHEKMTKILENKQQK